jgi:hypothetical protein
MGVRHQAVFFFSQFAIARETLDIIAAAILRDDGPANVAG